MKLAIRIALLSLLLGGAYSLAAQQVPIPRVDFNISQAKSPQQVALSLQILLLLTILSLAPAIILMLTSFTKIIIVFDFMKRALDKKRTKFLEDWLRNREKETTLNIDFNDYDKYFRE